MQNIKLRTPSDIGALIKDRRRALSLDQAELAKLIGVSRFWVNQTERGNPGAALGNVLRALATLGVELNSASDVPTSAATPIVSPDINAIVESARKKDRT
jgi:y4mF family transcriptional regulator